MPELPFDTSAILWKLMSDQSGIIRNHCLDAKCTLREAINYVLGQDMDERWRFAAVSNNVAIDHIEMQRIANTTIFRDEPCD